ncbi:MULTISPECIES: hypothetical protein [unclassified Streptomyces]|uniref:hypothetical protein n=1 Tax=unclassified Streptomyces TaxID=2593676 RepID=UPI003D941800
MTFTHRQLLHVLWICVLFFGERAVLTVVIQLWSCGQSVPSTNVATYDVGRTAIIIRVPCNQCGSELARGLGMSPTKPEGGSWVTREHCLATAIVMESGEVLRPSYIAAADRWCVALNESAGLTVEHAVVTALTLCGVDVEQVKLIGHGHSWSPLRATVRATSDRSPPLWMRDGRSADAAVSS